VLVEGEGLRVVVEGVRAVVGRAGAVSEATRVVVGGAVVALDGGVVPDGCWAGGMLLAMI
jgi:hypothetical protein